MDILNLQNRFQAWVARRYSRLASRSFASFGEGSILYYPARIDNPKNIHVGKNVILQSHVWINAVDHWCGRDYVGKIEIHDNACIMNNVQISAITSISIGRGAAIGRNCAIVDHYHDYCHLDMPILYAPLSDGKPVVIEEEAFLAVNCVITPGVTIGRHSFIGANSVVNTDIPPFSLAAGAPAKVLRHYDHEKGAWVGRREGGA
ncbi:MAG: acyltransferase [Desulfovibrio sp.]|nr:acyltransferase [Desulfovibrio sp.]